MSEWKCDDCDRRGYIGWCMECKHAYHNGSACDDLDDNFLERKQTKRKKMAEKRGYRAGVEAMRDATRDSLCVTDRDEKVLDETAARLLEEKP